MIIYELSFWIHCKKKWFSVNIFLFSKVYLVSEPVREICDNDLNGELSSAGEKLVVVEFFATGFEFFILFFLHSINNVIFSCNSSKSIAPHIGHLNAEYLNAPFLKADVEKCMVRFLFIDNKYYSCILIEWNN